MDDDDDFDLDQRLLRSLGPEVRAEQDAYYRRMQEEQARERKAGKTLAQVVRVRQSDSQFVTRVDAALNDAARRKKWTIKCADKAKLGLSTLYAYQRAVAEVFDPALDEDLRFAVLFGTGAGKTRCMVLCLDNFFDDVRPKCLIFPTERTRTQFYVDLVTFPNKYVQLYRTNSPMPSPSDAARVRQWIADFEVWLAMTGELHHAGAPGYLRAPVRTFTYTTAMGSAMAKGAATMSHYRFPSAALAHVADDARRDTYARTPAPSAFSNKVVLLDEAQDLDARDPDDANKDSEIQAANRAALRRELAQHAVRSAVAFFSATLPRDILENVVPGPAKAPPLFIYYDNLVAPIYPRVVLRTGAAGRQRQQINPVNTLEVRPVWLSDKAASDAYTKQATKHKKRPCVVSQPPQAPASPPSKKKKKERSTCTTLGPYNNVAGYPATLAKQQTTQPLSATPKAAAVVAAVAELAQEGGRGRKVAVLVHRAYGFELMQAALSRHADAAHVVAIKKPTNAKRAQIAALNKALDDFNALPAQTPAIVLLDARDYYKGINLINVSHLVLTNPAASWGEYKQSVGRPLRSCQNDPGVDVRITLLCATHEHYVTSDEVMLAKMLLDRSASVPYVQALERDGVGSRMLAKFSSSSSRGAASASTADDMQLYVRPMATAAAAASYDWAGGAATGFVTGSNYVAAVRATLDEATGLRQGATLPKTTRTKKYTEEEKAAFEAGKQADAACRKQGKAGCALLPPCEMRLWHGNKKRQRCGHPEHGDIRTLAEFREKRAAGRPPPQQPTPPTAAAGAANQDVVTADMDMVDLLRDL